MIRPAERFPVNVAEPEPEPEAQGSRPAAPPASSSVPVMLVILAILVGATTGWLLPTGGLQLGPAATVLAVDPPAAPGPAGIEPAAGPAPR
jgi:hypothetical protein